jgi:hypothetical protein
MVTGRIAILTDMAEHEAWTEQLAAPWNGDAAVRFSWLPATLPQVLSLLGEIRRADNVSATFTGRVIGAGVVRLSGEARAIAAAVHRLRASGDVGNVILLRASRELKETADVWGPPRSSDAAVRAIKRTLDPAGILNAARGPIS